MGAALAVAAQLPLLVGAPPAVAAPVVVAEPPVANPDPVATGLDANLEISPFANDNPGQSGSLIVPASMRLLSGTSPVTVLGVPGQGTYTVNTSTGAVTFDPLPTFSGPATPVSYVVTDENGISATSLIVVAVNAATTAGAPPATTTGLPATTTGLPAMTTTVPLTTAPPTTTAPAAPVANPDPVTTIHDTPLAISPLANDVPGPPGSVIAPGSVRLLAGIIPVTTLVVVGQGSYVANTTTGVVTFDPLPTFTGAAAPVSYSIADQNGTTATSTITVTVGSAPASTTVPPTSTTTPAPPPVANPDIITTFVDSNVEISPFANDNAGPSAAIVPASVRLLDGTTSVASLVVADQGTYTVATSTGVVTFDPAPGFAGIATPVSYLVTDGNGTTSTSTITVTVHPGRTSATPPPPTSTTEPRTAVLAAPDTISTGVDVNVEIAPFANDAPGSSGSLIVPGSVRLMDGFTQVTSLVVAGQGTYTVNTSTGVITFDPLSTFTGVTTPVSYAIADESGVTSTSTITVTVGPAATSTTAPPTTTPTPTLAPTTTPATTAPATTPTTTTATTPTTGPGLRGPRARDDSARTRPGEPVRIDVISNDVGDVDRSTLALLDPTTGRRVSVATILAVGTWAVERGEVVFDPAPGFTGTASITNEVADVTGRLVRATVTVTVAATTTTSPEGRSESDDSGSDGSGSDSADTDGDAANSNVAGSGDSGGENSGGENSGGDDSGGGNSGGGVSGGDNSGGDNSGGGVSGGGVSGDGDSDGGDSSGGDSESGDASGTGSGSSDSGDSDESDPESDADRTEAESSGTDSIIGGLPFAEAEITGVAVIGVLALTAGIGILLSSRLVRRRG